MFYMFRYIILFALTTSVIGCDSYFGKDTTPPLPGKRVAILIHDTQLTSDPLAAAEKILLPRPMPNDEWPQSGGFPNHAMHHMKSNNSISKAWSTDVGDGTDDDQILVAPPIIATNRVYTLDSNNMIVATDANNGRRIWDVKLVSKIDDEGHIGGGLAYYSGNIYVTTGFAELFCLDAKSGKILWRRKFNAPFRAAPTVRNKRIFAVTINNQLFAIDSSSGETKWSHRGVEEATMFLGSASPAVDTGIVVATYSSGEIVALKVENGRELWTDTISIRRKISSTMTLTTIRGRAIIDRGVVYVVSNSDQFTAINLRTGERIWSRNIGSIESPWIAGNFIFFISNNHELVSLSRKTGKIYWVTQLDNFSRNKTRGKGLTWTGPVLVSDRLIVGGSDGEILSISPYNGTILGKIKISKGITVEPVVALNTIFFLSQNAKLFAYR